MFQNIPTVVKNIIIINVLFFIASQVLPENFDSMMAGYFFSSDNFRPWQLVTHMFMHANMAHLFFNMYGLYLFGSVLENQWGSKRFLIYYLVCGLGAYFLHEGINYVEIQNMLAEYNTHPTLELKQNLSNSINTPVVGASGAVFGLLLAFGMLYPNTQLFLLFPPIPIKAKYFVIAYGAIELVMGLQNSSSDNVAHFAHIGGMIFGFLLLLFWKKKYNSYY